MMTMLTAQLTAENAVGTKQSFSVRTGVVQFKGDWPGIFIRGDDALGRAHAIRAVLRQTEEAQTRARETGASTSEWECLIELAELLESCRVNDGTEEEAEEDND
jgi:hypothetical protein